MFRKAPREKTRIERRVEKIATPDLMLWSEQSIYELGRQMSAWQRTREPVYLQEAELAAEALLAVVREIRARNRT